MRSPSIATVAGVWAGPSRPAAMRTSASVGSRSVVPASPAGSGSGPRLTPSPSSRSRCCSGSVVSMRTRPVRPAGRAVQPASRGDVPGQERHHVRREHRGVVEGDVDVPAVERVLAQPERHRRGHVDRRGKEAEIDAQVLERRRVEALELGHEPLVRLAEGGERVQGEQRVPARPRSAPGSRGPERGHPGGRLAACRRRSRPRCRGAPAPARPSSRRRPSPSRGAARRSRRRSGPGRRGSAAGAAIRRAASVLIGRRVSPG